MSDESPKGERIIRRRSASEVAHLILWRELVSPHESPVEYDLGSEAFATEVMQEMRRLAARLPADVQAQANRALRFCSRQLP